MTETKSNNKIKLRQDIVANIKIKTKERGEKIKMKKGRREEKRNNINSINYNDNNTDNLSSSDNNNT